MIKVRYDELGKVGTQQAVQKLANSSFKTPQAFYVKRLTKAIREGYYAMREEYAKDVHKKFFETEAPPAEGTKSHEMSLPYACKEGMEAEAKAALDGFGSRELKLAMRKLSPEMLFEVNEWTPRELESLEFLVSDPADPSESPVVA